MECTVDRSGSYSRTWDMRKRIRLGVSSMYGYATNSAQTGRARITSASSNPISDSAFSDLSASDLDEMFSANLRLLHNFDENDTAASNYKKSKHSSNFLSSLNVYISPHQGQKLCPVSRHNVCDNFSNRFQQPLKVNRTGIYSSYETLYDKWFFKSENDEKDQNSDSIVESSRGTIDDYLKFGSNNSVHSSRTLQSLSSDESTDVSSINSDDENREINLSNKSLPISKSITNDMNLHAKVRPRSEKPTSRPMSYHMGDSSGYYYSSKPPSYPLGCLRKEGTYAPTNIIINRSLKNSLLNSSNSSKLNVVLSNNPDVNISRNNILNYNYHVKDSNNNNNSGEVIRPQLVQSPQSLSSHTVTNPSVTPPIPPPRNRVKRFIANVTKKPEKKAMQTVSESSTSGSVKSSINLNISPGTKAIKSNGRTENYGDESRCPNNLESSTSYSKTTEVRIIKHKN